MEEKKMKTFMDKDFLLQTETAKKLYNDYAAAPPMIRSILWSGTRRSPRMLLST